MPGVIYQLLLDYHHESCQQYVANPTDSGSTTAAAAVVALPAVSVLPQYKYAVGVGNPPQCLNVKPQVTMQQPTVNVQGQETVTTFTLASVPPQVQKQICVNDSFLLFEPCTLLLLVKITHVFLETDNSEPLNRLEAPESL